MKALQEIRRRLEDCILACEENSKSNTVPYKANLDGGKESSLPQPTDDTLPSPSTTGARSSKRAARRKPLFDFDLEYQDAIRFQQRDLCEKIHWAFYLQAKRAICSFQITRDGFQPALLNLGRAVHDHDVAEIFGQAETLDFEEFKQTLGLPTWQDGNSFDHIFFEQDDHFTTMRGSRLKSKSGQVVVLAGSVKVEGGAITSSSFFSSISISSNQNLIKGKYYFEVFMEDFEVSRYPVAIIGWGTDQYSASSEKGLGCGCDSQSWGFDCRRGLLFHTVGESSLEAAKEQAKQRKFLRPLKTGETLCVALDLDAGRMTFCIDGTWEHYDRDGRSQVWADFTGSAGGICGKMRPIISLTKNARMRLRFSEADWKFLPPQHSQGERGMYLPLYYEAEPGTCVMRKANLSYARGNQRSYLFTLAEAVGSRPEACDSDRWIDDFRKLSGTSFDARRGDEGYVGVWGKILHSEIGKQGSLGEHDAHLIVECINYSGVLGTYLAEGSTYLSAITWKFYEFILNLRRQQNALDSQGGQFFDDLESLSSSNSQWLDLMHEDMGSATSFTAFESTVVYPRSCILAKQSEVLLDKSSNIYDMRLRGVGRVNLHRVSFLVCFVSSEQGVDGCYHQPVMIDPGTYMFPPLTLFTVVRTEDVLLVDGVCYEIKVIYVKATYMVQDSQQIQNDMNSRFGCSADILQYGSRLDYVYGVDSILHKPVCTMEEEWHRADKWKYWDLEKGVPAETNGRREWEYVVGTVPDAKDSQGQRDAGHEGWTLERFMETASQHIDKHWRPLSALRKKPRLKRDEVVALRLYSGPGFVPINTFLREVLKLNREWQVRVARDRQFTYSCSIMNLYSAIRKLSQLSMESLYPDRDRESLILYRGVRGRMNEAFYFKDELGILCATENGFMSTTLDKEIALEYMVKNRASSGVLWSIKQPAHEEPGRHIGAEISFVSQFPREREVLFPPLTMLRVMKRPEPCVSEASEEGGADGGGRGTAMKEFCIDTSKIGGRMVCEQIGATAHFV